MTMTEAERLQHAADTFTQQLALEKRRNVSLDDRISHMTSSIHVRKENLKQVQANTKEQQRLQTRIEQLENELLKERQYLNQHLSRNQRLRDQVDVYRREKRAFLSDFRDFEEKEKELVRESAKAYKEFMASHDVDSHTAHELVRTKLKGETELNTFESKAFALQSAIEQERKEEQIKMRQIVTAMMADLTNAKDYVDMRGLLQTLYEKWRDATAARKLEIEEHTRNIEVLREALDQIKEATGIASVQEVVTTFVKAEEQSYGFKRQIAALTTENDGLEEQLAALDATFAELKANSQAFEQSQLDLAKENEGKLQMLKSTRGKVDREADVLSEDVESLSSIVCDLLKPGQDLLDEPGLEEEFSVVNAEQTLGHVERSMSAVLMYLSLRGKNDPLPSAGLADKEFTWHSPPIPTLITELLEDAYDDADSPLSPREFTQRMLQRLQKRGGSLPPSV